MLNFEKLEVWRKSIEFADLVYELARSFPVEGRFGLANQMRRAPVAIDDSRFIELAAGSLFEVISHAHIATRRGSIKEESFQSLHASAEELSRMLSGLKSYLRKGLA